jgi:hypothetical protein
MNLREAVEENLKKRCQESQVPVRILAGVPPELTQNIATAASFGLCVRPGCRWKGSINIDFRETVCQSAE